MKNYLLYLMVKVEVESSWPTLSQTIQEFEKQTDYGFSDTDHVKVTRTELLETEPFNP